MVIVIQNKQKRLPRHPPHLSWGSGPATPPLGAHLLDTRHSRDETPAPAEEAVQAVQAGQVRSGQVRSGRVRSGQVRSG